MTAMAIPFELVDGVPRDGCFAVAASPDGTIAAAFESEGVWLRRSRGEWKQVLAQQVGDLAVPALAFDDGQLAVGTAGWGLRFVDMATGSAAGPVPDGGRAGRYIAAMAHAPGGRVVAATGEGLLVVEPGGSWRIVGEEAAPLPYFTALAVDGAALMAGGLGRVVEFDAGLRVVRDAPLACLSRPAAVRAVFVEGSRLLAGTDEGLAVSGDRGASWRMLGAQGPQEGVRALALLDGGGIVAAGWRGVGVVLGDGPSWMQGAPRDARGLAVAGEALLVAAAGGLYRAGVGIASPSWSMPNRLIMR